MERLYELFVAEWLKAHLPYNVLLKVQEQVDIGEGEVLSFRIDLVLYDAETGQARCVLDTKYKARERPEPDDVAKIVAYAEMKGCNEAILVYPIPLSKPLDEPVGNIRVQSMTFSLQDNLEETGQAFMRCLLSDEAINACGQTEM
jgi:5-methylcytosine-specific restriction enzyme subunit McrC